MLFIEKEVRYSPYIKFQDMDSLAAGDVPRLSILRVEMERVHPGMTDFIMRVSTPRYSGAKKSGTVLSIRGNRSFTKFETMSTLANTICDEMKKRGDSTYEWENTDLSHLADLIYGPTKYFSANTRVESLKFSTEALA